MFMGDDEINSEEKYISCHFGCEDKAKEIKEKDWKDCHSRKCRRKVMKMNVLNLRKFINGILVEITI